jgi:hypothetical protein
MPVAANKQIPVVESQRLSAVAQLKQMQAALQHLFSTFRGQAGILVGVHSVLRESLRFGNISVPRSDRVGNLLKLHSDRALARKANNGPRSGDNMEPSPSSCVPSERHFS